MSNAAYIDPLEARAKRNRAIARDYAAGVPPEEISARSGVARTTVLSIARGLGARLPPHRDKRSSPVPRTVERNKQICAEYLSGDSLETVGQRHGLTRERVRQILVKYGHEERHNGFNSPWRATARARAFPKLLEKEEKRERRKARLALARELYNAGETYNAISERMGASIAWVQNAVWATGGPSRNRNVGKLSHRLTQADRAEIARRYAAGEPPHLIAADFDIARAVAAQIANKMGAYRT